MQYIQDFLHFQTTNKNVKYFYEALNSLSMHNKIYIKKMQFKYFYVPINSLGNWMESESTQKDLLNNLAPISTSS